MHIYAVILRSGKVALFNHNRSAASWKMHEVGRWSQKSSGAVGGFAVYTGHSDVAGVLAHDSQPVHVPDVQLLQCHILAFKQQHADLTADNVSQSDCRSGFRHEAFRCAESEFMKCCFLNITVAQHIPVIAIHKMFVVRGVLDAMDFVGLPALSYKFKALTLYGVAGVAVNLYLNASRFCCGVSQLWTSGSLEIDIEILQGHILAADSCQWGHVSVHHECGSVSVNHHIFESG